MNFLEKRFSKFISYLRLNYKDTAKANLIYVITALEEDAFMIFFLKVLLNEVKTLQNKSASTKSASTTKASALGARTSVPFPDGGISSIKSGSIPDLDLKSLVDSLLEKAITDFRKLSVANPSIIYELEQVNETNANLESLNRIDTSLKVSIVRPSLNLRFDIRTYLREADAILIHPVIRKNIRILHDTTVAPLYSFLEADLSIRNGILPLYSKNGIPEFLANYFNDGKAVELYFANHTVESVIESILNGSIPSFDTGFIYNFSSAGSLILTSPIEINGSLVTKELITETV